MDLCEVLLKAKERIVFVGILPFAEEIEDGSDFFANLLCSTPKLRLVMLCESDTLCFQNSLLTDVRGSRNRKSYAVLATHRDRILGTMENRGFAAEMGKLASIRSDFTDRVLIRQQNAAMPFYALVVDGTTYCAIMSTHFPTCNDYCKLDKGSSSSSRVLDYVDFFLNGDGSQYLSAPEDELLQLYDRDNYPRGIYPRSCFYTAKFKRHSMWGFVFNRKGQILLHQRSFQTKDGRGLWDKSVGGHIDLREDVATTAKRELIEELFMEEAEFTSYIDARIKDIVGFGEWNLNKRPESSYRGAFEMLDADDWILFSATDKEKEGEPLVIDRVSQRRYHLAADNVVFRPTNFVSDVFLFIAPAGCIDTQEQMQKRFEFAEKKGAAQAHKLITLNELRDWIEDKTQDSEHAETFTDDLIYVNNEYMGMLERFSEFVRYIFNG